MKTWEIEYEYCAAGFACYGKVKVRAKTRHNAEVNFYKQRKKSPGYYILRINEK